MYLLLFHLTYCILPCEFMGFMLDKVSTSGDLYPLNISGVDASPLIARPLV